MLTCAKRNNRLHHSSPELKKLLAHPNGFRVVCSDFERLNVESCEGRTRSLAKVFCETNHGHAKSTGSSIAEDSWASIGEIGWSRTLWQWVCH